MTTTLTFFAPPPELNKTILTLPGRMHSPSLDPRASGRYRQAPDSPEQVSAGSDSGQLSRVELVVKALIAEYLQDSHFRLF